VNRDGVIVIADGDEGDRELASAALRNAGYDTVDVATGADALEAVRANEVALVVLEVGLPDVTGYEICRELRKERGEDLPIFFLSGLRTEALVRVAGLLLGADDFIVKPFNRGELVARVRGFVNRRSLTQDLSEGARGPRLTRRDSRSATSSSKADDRRRLPRSW